MNLDDIQLDFRVGSFQHKAIAILAKADKDTITLRKESGATIRPDRVREILMDMKQAKLITTTSQHDTWAITTQGLHVSVLLGPVPETSIVRKVSREQQMTELFSRGTYSAKELGFTCLRRGAYDAFILPSRIANTLHYPNGRTEQTDHATKQ